MSDEQVWQCAYFALRLDPSHGVGASLLSSYQLAVLFVFVCVCGRGSIIIVVFSDVVVHKTIIMGCAGVIFFSTHAKAARHDDRHDSSYRSFFYYSFDPWVSYAQGQCFLDVISCHTQLNTLTCCAACALVAAGWHGKANSN